MSPWVVSAALAPDTWLQIVIDTGLGIWHWLWANYAQEIATGLLLAVFAIVRAMGRTVDSGSTGLKFSFGRAVREVGPGFYPLIPFLQVIRTLPTRSRTLDLPEQRVTTLDGLVYQVDVNLVYRVVDIRKALIQIDDLERGMLQVLGLAVQEVLRARSRAELYASEALDLELSRWMARQLEPWGIVVEHAGFPTIHPSAETTKVTQLAALGSERAAVFARLRARGADGQSALALLGVATRFEPRTHRLAARARADAARRRIALAARRAVDQERYEREHAGAFGRAVQRASERQKRRAESRRQSEAA
jgi:regulator of protease activity HflC (stomatin/prohibitin superfamily)